MPPINRWLKLAVLVAVPCILFWLIVEQMSWLRPQPLAPMSGLVYSIAFSPDGKLMATGAIQKKYLSSNTGAVNTVQIWDVSSQQVIKTLQQNEIAGRLAFLPGGDVLACVETGNRAGSLRLYDVKTGKPLLTLVRGSDMIALSPDGKTVANQRADDRSIIEFWDVETRQRNTFLQATERTYAGTFSPDGRLLATATFNERKYSLDLWEVETALKVATLPENGTHLNQLTFSPDGQQLAAIAYDKIQIWDMNTTRPPRAVVGAAQSMSAIAFSPDSSLLAVGTVENVVHLRSAKTGELLRTMTMHRAPKLGVTALAFSPDGSTLACGGSEGQMNLWRIR